LFADCWIVGYPVFLFPGFAADFAAVFLGALLGAFLALDFEAADFFGFFTFAGLALGIVWGAQR
jgi:hypothetical protein